MIFVHLLLIVANFIVFFLDLCLLLSDPSINVVNEFIYTLKVVFSVFLNVIVASHFYKVGWKTFVHNFLPETLTMTNMNYLIPMTMDNVDRAVEVFDSVDIWKFIETESPPKI